MGKNEHVTMNIFKIQNLRLFHFQIGAPMKGDVVVVKVKPGDHVETGQVGDDVDDES